MCGRGGDQRAERRAGDRFKSFFRGRQHHRLASRARVCMARSITVLVGCTPLFWRSPFPPRSYRTRACVRSFVHFMPCRAFPGPMLRFSSQSTCPAQLCRCKPGARAVHLPRVRACLAPFCCRGWSLAAAVQFVASSVARSISGVAAQSPSVRVDISRFRSYLGECASVNICAHVT